MLRARISGCENWAWIQVAEPYIVMVSTHRAVILSDYGRNIGWFEAQWARVNVPIDQGEETLQPFCAIKKLTHILSLCQQSNHIASCNWVASLFCACRWTTNFCDRTNGRIKKKKHSQAFSYANYLS